MDSLDINEREVHIVDGQYVDAHLEGVFEQFQTDNFDIDYGLDGALNNIIYFIRELLPEFSDIEVDLRIYESVESAIKFASKFGFITILPVSDPEVEIRMTSSDRNVSPKWAVKLGSFDAGKMAFATTLKGAILLSVVQYLREIFHATNSPRSDRKAH